MRRAVNIPVIASSGAGTPQHFVDVFDVCGVEAGLAASIFHKNIVSIPEVKAHCAFKGIPMRAADAKPSELSMCASEQWFSSTKKIMVLSVFAVAVAVGLAVARR